MSVKIAEFKCPNCHKVYENVPYCAMCKSAIPNECKLNIVKLSSEANLEIKRKANLARLRKRQDIEMIGKKFNAFGNLVDDPNYEPSSKKPVIKSFEVRSVAQKPKKRNPTKVYKRSKISPLTREKVYLLHGNKCLCCGENKYSELTIDHVIPVSKGGRNSIDNYQPLCYTCNGKKGDRIRDYRTIDKDADLYDNYENIKSVKVGGAPIKKPFTKRVSPKAVEKLGKDEIYMNYFPCEKCSINNTSPKCVSCGEIIFYKYAKQAKLKRSSYMSGNIVFADSDNDLFNDFENKKAASIISHIHRGINRKKDFGEKSDIGRMYEYKNIIVDL